MQKSSQKFLQIVFSLFFLLSASGCIPLIIGAAAGVGGYAWANGEMVQEMNASAEKLHRAATRAVRDLKLNVQDDNGDRISARIKAKFYDGTDVSIAIQANTEYKSKLKIRVGILGDKEKSEAILNAIMRRL